MLIENLARKNGGINPENLILVKTYSEQSTVRESWKVALKRQWNSFETIIILVLSVTLVLLEVLWLTENYVLTGCGDSFWIGARECKREARLRFYINRSQSVEAKQRNFARVFFLRLESEWFRRV